MRRWQGKVLCRTEIGRSDSEHIDDPEIAQHVFQRILDAEDAHHVLDGEDRREESLEGEKRVASGLSVRVQKQDRAKRASESKGEFLLFLSGARKAEEG